MYDDLFNKLKKTNEFITKEQIYALYDQVSKEIESGMKDNGVWTKAYADARGDLQAAKGIYIELMVERYVLAGEAQQEAFNKSQKSKKRAALMSNASKKVKTVGQKIVDAGNYLDNNFLVEEEKNPIYNFFIWLTLIVCGSFLAFSLIVALLDSVFPNLMN